MKSTCSRLVSGLITFYALQVAVSHAGLFTNRYTNNANDIMYFQYGAEQIADNSNDLLLFEMQYDGLGYWATRVNSSGHVVYRYKIASPSTRVIPRWSECTTPLPNGDIVSSTGDYDFNPPTSTDFDLLRIHSENGTVSVLPSKIIRPCPTQLATPSNDFLYLGGMSTNAGKYDPTFAKYNLNSASLEWAFRIDVRSVIDSAYANDNLFAEVLGELSDGTFLIGVVDDEFYPVLMVRVNINLGGTPSILWASKPVRITGNNRPFHNCHVKESDDAVFCGYWSNPRVFGINITDGTRLWEKSLDFDFFQRRSEVVRSNAAFMGIGRKNGQESLYELDLSGDLVFSRGTPTSGAWSYNSKFIYPWGSGYAVLGMRSNDPVLSRLDSDFLLNAFESSCSSWYSTSGSLTITDISTATWNIVMSPVPSLTRDDAIAEATSSFSPIHVDELSGVGIDQLCTGTSAPIPQPTRNPSASPSANPTKVPTPFTFYPAKTGENVLFWILQQSSETLKTDLLNLYTNQSCTCTQPLRDIYEDLKSIPESEQQDVFMNSLLPRLS